MKHSRWSDLKAEVARRRAARPADTPEPTWPECGYLSCTNNATVTGIPESEDKRTARTAACPEHIAGLTHVRPLGPWVPTEPAQWTAKEQPPGGATALLDNGTVAAIIYLPWGLALGQRIAALLNASPTPNLPDEWRELLSAAKHQCDVGPGRTTTRLHEAVRQVCALAAAPTEDTP